MKVSFLYSQTFSDLIDLCISHLAPFSSEKHVIERIVEVIDRFEKTVSENPEAMHVSPHLLTLGMTVYREFTADGFRVLYRLDDNASTINVAVFCSQKQDLAQILIDYCLLHK